LVTDVTKQLPIFLKESRKMFKSNRLTSKTTRDLGKWKKHGKQVYYGVGILAKTLMVHMILRVIISLILLLGMYILL